MGGFFNKGFDAYLEGGMPWLFQQGLVASTFYHFYAHDTVGWIGQSLRGIVKPTLGVVFMTIMGADEKEREDDVLFAKVFVGMFMLVMAIVRMPHFLGPSFSPFTALGNLLSVGKKKGKKVNVVPPSSKSKKKKTKAKKQ